MNVKQSKHELNFLQCTAALDKYAVGGAAAKQFKLSSGLAHCAIVKHVANKAWQDGQRHQVAVKYDELIREKWASLAYQAGATGIFDIDEAMCNLDEKVYAAALA